MKTLSLAERSLSNLLGAATLCAAILLAGPAAAQTQEPFFAGKQIKLIISTGPGGGYDTNARLFARFYGAHVPGNPTMVPQNMPGAGGIRASSFVYSGAPKDGTTIAIVDSSNLIQPLLKNTRDQFDPTKVEWLGNMSSEPSLCVSWHETPIKTTEDFLTKEFIVGGSGAGGQLEVYPKILNSILGTKMKIISGYPGGTDVVLAMERGEVQGRCGWSLSGIESTRVGWLEEKKLNILVQLGAKAPEIPTVPEASELAKSQEDKDILHLIFSDRMVQRPFMAPPGVPVDRVEILRTAFMATMADKGFLAEAERMKLQVMAMPGAEVQAYMDRLYTASPAVIDKTRAALGE
jgi:tripartite-type tricarboxylate transporter receptor subunit TctC